MLTLADQRPGIIVVGSHAGEPNVSRVGAAAGVFGGDEPSRHISVRMPFADERAEAFMTGEARQLSTDAPGLIMIGMAHAAGGMKVWEPLILRRFQPTIHTRVSAVCLFGGGMVSTTAGEAILDETKLLVNPHARFSLPLWIAAALTEAGSEWRRTLPPDE